MAHFLQEEKKCFCPAAFVYEW